MATDDPSSEISDSDIAEDLALLNKSDELEAAPTEEVEAPPTDELPPELQQEEPTELPAALKAKYPDIYKEFPELRKAVFHEKEFLKLFGTVEEAKEAAVKAENHDYLLGEIEKGNLQPLISGLKEVDENVFKLFAAKVLPAIYTESKDVYYSIIDPVLIRVLKSAHEQGERTNNDNLKYSAQHLAQLLFNDSSVLDKPILGTPQTNQDPDRLQFEEEKKQFLTARFNDARVSVDSHITTELQKEIGLGLTNLNISGYLKKVISKEVQAEIDVVLAQTPEHMSQMNTLWKNAAKAGYSSELLARITSTYLARAKPLIHSIRSKVKAELTKSKPTVPGEKLPISGAASAKAKGPVNSKKVDWSKTTDDQFVAGEITYKK